MITQPHDTASALERNLVERVNVGDILTRSADAYPDKIALIDGDRRLTYAEFERKVNRLSRALIEHGLSHQDVVAVMARNCTELLLVYFACARAGLVCAPMNLGLSPPEIAYCLRDARAGLLIAEQALQELAAATRRHELPDLREVFWIGQDAATTLPPGEGRFDDLLIAASDAPLEVQVQDRDVVQLLYTSGTTGHPKGVLTSHLAVTMAGLSNALGHSCKPDVVTLVALPLFHCAMLNSITVPVLLVGGTVVLSQGFEPHQGARLFEEHGVQLVVLLPMMYSLMLSDPLLRERRFPAMRRAMYAMAPMPEERLRKIHDMFPHADVVLGSGQTEFTPATCMQRPEHQWSKAATWGTATAMTRVAIMDDVGRLLPRGETGEIVYRGPQVMTGYLNLPGETAASLRHGWFHSGDVAHMDDDGAIWFKDRHKDVIKTGGENVASLEVERCLLEHPAVVDAAVVGVPHPHWGEAITAVVVLSPGQTLNEQALLAHCRERLAGFKVPKAVVFLGAFPRTGTGKIQKHMIRSQVKDLFLHDTPAAAIAAKPAPLNDFPAPGRTPEIL